MKIYTKRGDNGTTSLVGGSRIEKSDAQLEAYGTIDELNAALGMALEEMRTLSVQPEKIQMKDDCVAVLENILNHLFTIGGMLATEPDNCDKFWPSANVEEWTARLENHIDTYSMVVPPFKGFVLPCGSKATAALHFSRTVCRRAERAICRFAPEGSYPAVRQYINRLSDLLFVTARYALVLEGKEEICWKK